MDDTKVSNFHIAQVSEQYVELPELPSLPQYQSPPPTPTKDNDTRFGGGPYDMSLLSNSCKHVADHIWVRDVGIFVYLYLCFNFIFFLLSWTCKPLMCIDKPSQHLGWFWDIVYAYDFSPHIHTPFSQVNPSLCTTLIER